MDEIRIRDHRTRNWFSVDNAVIRDYGWVIGPYGIAVYAALCMHADVHDQSCWPSHALIAKEIGAGVTKVKECINLLVEIGLLAREGRLREDGGQTSNEYIILDPPSRVATTPPSQSDEAPSRDTATNNTQLEQEPSINDTPPVSEPAPATESQSVDRNGSVGFRPETWEERQARIDRALTGSVGRKPPSDYEEDEPAEEDPLEILIAGYSWPRARRLEPGQIKRLGRPYTWASGGKTVTGDSPRELYAKQNSDWQELIEWLEYATKKARREGNGRVSRAQVLTFVRSFVPKRYRNGRGADSTPTVTFV